MITFQTKKNLAVTFAIPVDTGEDTLQSVGGIDDGEITRDNYEVIDEKTSLLKAEGGSVQPAETTQKSGSVHGTSSPVAQPPVYNIAASQFASSAGQVATGQAIDTGTDSVDSRVHAAGVTSGKEVHRSQG